MNIKTKKLLSLFFIGISLTTGCVQKEDFETEKPLVTENEATEENVLKLAVQPCWGTFDSFTMFTPLTNYLSEETGLPIKLIIVETEKDFHETMPEVHFTMQDAFSVYIHNRQDTIFRPLTIAVSEEGLAEESGTILVRADSTIENISDLKGKTFLFGSPHNTPKFFAAFVSLGKAGIVPDRDLKSYNYGGDCYHNAMSVFLGEYDAGVVCKSFVKGKGKTKFDFKTDLRILAETLAVANWMVAASMNTDKETAEKVRQALLTLWPDSPRAEKILEKTEWSGFIAVTGNELSGIDKLVRKYSVPLYEE